MNRKSSSGLGAFIAVIVVLLIAGAVIKAIPALLKGMIWLLVVIVVLVIVLVIAVIVIALKGSGKKKEPVEMSDNKNPAMKKKPTAVPPQTPPADDQPAAPPLTVEQENILTKGRTNLLELRKIIVKIRDPEIHQMSNEICDINEKILKTLREKPEKIPQVRQFLNYYLPTLGEILVKYQRIEQSGVPAQKSEKMVEKYLVDIKKAMQKQYENLYDDDKLDLSVEMEAMTIAAKSDGLISDDDYKIEDGDHEISLTL